MEMDWKVEEETIRLGYTRVTDILGPWNNFEAIPKDVLKNKCRIGSEVHYAIDMYNKCIPYSYEGDGVGYYNSFLCWTEEFRASAVESEVRYYDDEFKITGGIDAILKIPHEDRLVVADWKTCASYNKKMATSWSMQGAFYHYLLEKNDIANISNRFLYVQLDPDGKMPKIREFNYTTALMNEAATLLAAYRIYNPI